MQRQRLSRCQVRPIEALASVAWIKVHPGPMANQRRWEGSRASAASVSGRYLSVLSRSDTGDIPKLRRPLRHRSFHPLIFLVCLEELLWAEAFKPARRAAVHAGRSFLLVIFAVSVSDVRSRFSCSCRTKLFLPASAPHLTPIFHFARRTTVGWKRLRGRRGIDHACGSAKESELILRGFGVPATTSVVFAVILYLASLSEGQV